MIERPYHTASWSHHRSLKLASELCSCQVSSSHSGWQRWMHFSDLPLKACLTVIWPYEWFHALCLQICCSAYHIHRSQANESSHEAVTVFHASGCYPSNHLCPVRSPSSSTSWQKSTCSAHCFPLRSECTRRPQSFLRHLCGRSFASLRSGCSRFLSATRCVPLSTAGYSSA